MSGSARTSLVAVDLDLTLIYSGRFLERSDLAGAGLPNELVLVEAHIESGALSFASQALRAQIDRLREVSAVVPVTTRTRAQLERLSPLGSDPFNICVCANGATLLINGSEDEAWDVAVRNEIRGACPIRLVGSYLDSLKLSRRGVRYADERFCYLVIDDDTTAAAALPSLRAALECFGWSAWLSGRKLYALPKGLTKAAAVQRLAGLIDAARIVAIGDSTLDLSMLEVADYSIAPLHADLSVRQAVDFVSGSEGPTAAVECLTAALHWLDPLRSNA